MPILVESAVASAAAQSDMSQGVQQTKQKVSLYRLEKLSLVGSERMTAEQVQTELGLVRGTSLDDELVMSTRSKLLSLGLFRSVILVMKRGSKPGWAELVIQVEDDETVFSDWALGGEATMTFGESDVSTLSSKATPLGYRLGLIGRNLFRRMHRGFLTVDLDGLGVLRSVEGAYGLPRFANEDTQFDIEGRAVDITRRYLDAMAFADKMEALWTQSLSDFDEIQYGPVMYLNRPPRFGFPDFPKIAAGPKLAYGKETRVLGFLPGRGYHYGSSLLLSMVDIQESVTEVSVAGTYDLLRVLYATLDAQGSTVGTYGVSWRTEGRLDVPITAKTRNGDQAAAFLRLRSGIDRCHETDFFGSEAILGIRYHSSGFIAEFAVQFTQTPDRLTTKQVNLPALREDSP